MILLSLTVGFIVAGLVLLLIWKYTSPREAWIIGILVFIAIALISYMIMVVLALVGAVQDTPIDAIQVPIESDDNIPPSQFDPEAVLVTDLYHSYINAGQSCDISRAMEFISSRSQAIVHFTCANFKAETDCYIDRPIQVAVNEDKAVIYPTPFSHDIENPFYFIREDDTWRIDLYRMSEDLAMRGNSCDSGWNWRSSEAQEYFCSFFAEGECPDKY